MNRLLVTGLALITLLGPALSAQEEDARVPDQHLETYFGGKPDTFLVDPQRLLPPNDRRERERFLVYHSEDSEVDFHLLLFGNGQTIPSDIRLEELAERFYGEGRPSLLALYFLGEPDRARLMLSPQIAEVINPTELGRLRGQAIRAAETKSVPAEQLEDFCIQLAIGIFWIEREAGLGGGSPSVETGDSDTRPTPEPPGNSAFSEIAEEWGLPGAVIAGGVLAALLAGWILRRRARYPFPESLPPERLGAPHGGGVGAVINFKSSTQSPSKQKSDTKDSLGGL